MRTFLGIFVAVALLFFVCGCDPLAASRSGNRESKSAQSNIKEIAIGETTTIGDFEFTIHSFETKSTISAGSMMQYSADKGSTYVIVNITIKNVSKSMSKFLPMVNMRDDQRSVIKLGEIEFARSSFLALQGYLADESLQPLQTKEGFLAFEIPDEALKEAGLTFVYKSGKSMIQSKVVIGQNRGAQAKEGSGSDDSATEGSGADSESNVKEKEVEVAETTKKDDIEVGMAAADGNIEIGATTTIGDFEFTVNSFETKSSISAGSSMQYKASKGSTYVVVNITLKNVSTSLSKFLPNFNMRDDQRTAIKQGEMEFVRSSFLSVRNDLADASLQPLQTKEGFLAFAIPDEVLKAGGLTFVYQAGKATVQTEVVIADKKKAGKGGKR